MKTLLYLFTLAVIYSSSALAAAPDLTIAAKKCTTLTCVRSGINVIDQKIIAEIGKRLAYVKRAGELKKNVKSVHDQQRENQILAAVAEQAKKMGYSGDIAKAVFKTILQQSNIYEKQFHHYQ